jgi:hypothetical protein
MNMSVAKNRILCIGFDTACLVCSFDATVLREREIRICFLLEY